MWVNREPVVVVRRTVTLSAEAVLGVVHAMAMAPGLCLLHRSAVEVSRFFTPSGGTGFQHALLAHAAAGRIALHGGRTASIILPARVGSIPVGEMISAELRSALPELASAETMFLHVLADVEEAVLSSARPFEKGDIPLARITIDLKATGTLVKDNQRKWLERLPWLPEITDWTVTETVDRWVRDDHRRRNGLRVDDLIKAFKLESEEQRATLHEFVEDLAKSGELVRANIGNDDAILPIGYRRPSAVDCYRVLAKHPIPVDELGRKIGIASAPVEHLKKLVAAGLARQDTQGHYTRTEADPMRALVLVAAHAIRRRTPDEKRIRAREVAARLKELAPDGSPGVSSAHLSLEALHLPKIGALGEEAIYELMREAHGRGLIGCEITEKQQGEAGPGARTMRPSDSVFLTEKACMRLGICPLCHHGWGSSILTVRRERDSIVSVVHEDCPKGAVEPTFSEEPAADIGYQVACAKCNALLDEEHHVTWARLQLRGHLGLPGWISMTMRQLERYSKALEGRAVHGGPRASTGRLLEVLEDPTSSFSDRATALVVLHRVLTSANLHEPSARRTWVRCVRRLALAFFRSRPDEWLMIAELGRRDDEGEDAVAAAAAGFVADPVRVIYDAKHRAFVHPCCG